MVYFAGENSQAGWRARVILRENHLDMEHSASVHRVSGCTNIAMPSEDRVVKGRSWHSHERNFWVAQFFEILLEAADRIALMAEDCGSELGSVIDWPCTTFNSASTTAPATPATHLSLRSCLHSFFLLVFFWLVSFYFKKMKLDTRLIKHASYKLI